MTTTNEQTPQTTPKPPRRYFRRAVLAIGSTIFMLGLLAGIIVTALSGQKFTAPDWATDRLVAALNESLAPAKIDLSTLEIVFRERAAPLVSLVGIRVFDGEEKLLAFVPRAQLSLDRQAIMGGSAVPQSVKVEGLRVALERNTDGTLDVALGEREGGSRFGGSPGEVVETLNSLLDAPGLEALDEISATDVRLVISDRLSDRVWDISDGSLSLSRLENDAEFKLGFATDGFGQENARVDVSVRAASADLSAELGLGFDNLGTSDIAAWGSSLSWLELLHAPASGSMRFNLNETGDLGSGSASLDIGKGILQIPNTERSVRLNEGRTYFTYEPEKALLAFDQIYLSTSEASFDGEGQVLLREGPRGTELVSQLQFREVTLAPSALAPFDPVHFESGGIDARLILEPFRVDIGQMTLSSGPSRFALKGSAEVGPDQFKAGIDVTLDRMSTDNFLALWPASVVPDSREWLGENLLGGTIKDANASVRIVGQDPPVVGVGFVFDDAVLRFLPQQPPLIDLDGYGSLNGPRLTIVADRARVQATEDAQVDASGTVFSIIDVDARPGVAEIDVRVKGPLEAQLALLDNKPFEFLSKAGQPTNIAQGHAETRALVRLPLLEYVPDDQIFYDVTATALDVESTVLVPGHRLESPRLSVKADRQEGLRIFGPGSFSGIAGEGEWVLPLADDADGSSRLVGSMTVSQSGSDALGIGLPPGTIRNEGIGRVEIDFPAGSPPKLRFFTDLNRLQLSLPPIGWAKSPSRTGELEVLATLSSPMSVDAVTFSAPGLRANGVIELDDDGLLEQATFDRVRVGGWFDGPVDLIGRGENAPFDIAVNGGVLDIRTSEFGGASGGESGALDVNLNRLVISDGVSLTNLSGSFGSSAGLQGRFTGRVNGGTRVTGSLVPSKFGTAVNIRSKDGGGVIRDAGLLDNAHGGDLQMTLVPRETEGFYDGTLEITNVRIRDAPALAELLSAVSVVGLLEQLDGGGLAFGSVSAEFVLTPNSVVIKGSRAVGASLGLTMDGRYDLESGNMDMQGVVSPVYVINGLGQIVSRRGEGLIGISYRMRGQTGDPRVSINPLSLLTPGFLRDIFRKPAPKIEE